MWLFGSIGTFVPFFQCSSRDFWCMTAPLKRQFMQSKLNVFIMEKILITWAERRHQRRTTAHGIQGQNQTMWETDVSNLNGKNKNSSVDYQEQSSESSEGIRRMKKSCASAQLSPLAPDHTPPRLSETHAHTTSISCLSPSHTCSLCLKCLVTFPEWPCVLPFTRDHQWSGGGIDIPTSRTGNILRKMLVQLRIKVVTMQGKARKGLHPSNERSFHWSKQTNHKTLRSRLFWLEYISVASLPSSSQKCLKGYPSNLPGTICKRGFGFLSIKTR